MNSQRAQTLIDDYASNSWLIHRLVDGITHEASLYQLPFSANCLNWLLGHIVWRRTSALTTLDLPSPWGETIIAKYQTNSKPIQSSKDARHLAKLLADLDYTQQVLSVKLANIEDTELDKVVVNDRGEKRVIEHLQGFHWHETYHIGQLDILRAFIEYKG